MSNANKEELNAVVTEYAITAMKDYAFTCEEFQYVLHKYRKPLNPNLTRCEADVRTLGLSRPYVVTSCKIENSSICFSDFSGKKQRQTVLTEFPNRKSDFAYWYANNQKPYQHISLYEHINQTLGTIGTFTRNVNHPIGYCAEMNVANRLMLATDEPYQDAKFSIAIRPKTGEIIPYCDNCKSLFSQLNDEND